MLVMDVGEKLAMARDYHRPALTQSEFAPMLGIKRGTLARWEADNEAPPKAVAKAATMLGIPLEWFYDKGDTPPPIAINSAMGNDPRKVTSKEEKPNAMPVSERDMGSGPATLKETREVLLPIWRGVLAGSDGECVFEPNDTEFISLPAFVVTGDPKDFRVCVASGQSMNPRIEQGEQAVIRLNPNPQLNTIVIARHPDGGNYIKVLRKGADGELELHPLNSSFRPICHLEGWILEGEVTAIFHTYEAGKGNIEWDNGRPLKA